MRRVYGLPYRPCTASAVHSLHKRGFDMGVLSLILAIHHIVVMTGIAPGCT